VNETNCSRFKKRAAAIAVASCLSLSPWLAEAAGLGKLTVLSGLGQPLRAELELAANRDELTGMTARLAPQDAFRQAGIEYASSLLDLRFAVEKRPNGQSVIKVTSGRPVNEPFLDFLVELNWPSGRLVREYTFLLDPPEVAARQAARSTVDAKVIDTVQGGSAQGERPVSAKSAPRSTAGARLPAESSKSNGDAKRIVVQPGDTLRKIAGENQYDGVSLEQMLVGLFRKNPEAFVGSNINRLKAGAILGMPEKAAVEAVSEAEAKKVYVTQAADWNAYRHKLAAATAKAPASDETVSQASAGKITAKVEEKATPVEQAKDKVKVSPTEMVAKGAGGKSAAESESDRIAKDKALKEAQERLAMLEKSVNELQKLVELKNQKLAELQQQNAAKKEELKPVEPPKVVEAAKPPEPPKAAEPAPPPVEAAKPAEEVKPPVVEKPVEAPKPEPLPTPVKKPVPPPPPPPEPSLLDSLLEDPLPLAGGAGILALLAGYFMVKRRRESGSAETTTAAPGPSSLGPNSVFRMTGGQSVDTGNTPPQTGDFSQTGPGTIDTDEVDPVAEADVYMAYGRDTQAEEILLEAMQKDPQRTAIHAKLLEIYAGRRSLKQFETLASELYAQTGGVGADWEKAAALGVGLDPDNPLYTGSAKPAAAFDANATMVASPEAIAKSTLTMPAGALAHMAQAEELEPVSEPDAEFDLDTLVLTDAPAEPSPMAAPEPAPEIAAMDLDFDLGASVSPAESPAEPEPVASAFSLPEVAAPEDIGSALDFDLAAEAAPPAATQSPGELHVAEDADVDFSLDFDATPEAQAAPETSHDFSPEETLVTSLPAADSGVATYVGDATQIAPVGASSGRDESMVDFDLDLDVPSVQTSVNPVTESFGTETVVVPHPVEESESAVSPQLTETMLSPAPMGDSDSMDFDINLTDSVFLGEPMTPPEFDIGSINLDLAAEPTVAAAPPTPAAEAAASVEAAPHDSQWEEVNTKLDLAKAYEEMGDLEGARELLQEVVVEGSVDLVEQARTILGRIGE